MSTVVRRGSSLDRERSFERLHEASEIEGSPDIVTTSFLLLLVVRHLLLVAWHLFLLASCIGRQMEDGMAKMFIGTCGS